jgi:hypothetical protein
MAIADDYQTVMNNSEFPQFFDYGGQTFIFHPHPKFKKGWFKVEFVVTEQQFEQKMGPEREPRRFTRKTKTQRLVPDPSRPGNGPHSFRVSESFINDVLRPATGRPPESQKSSAGFVYQEQLLDAAERGFEDIVSAAAVKKAELAEDEKRLAQIKLELAELEQKKDALAGINKDAAVDAALAKLAKKNKE